MRFRFILTISFLVFFMCINITVGVLSAEKLGENVVPNFSFEEGSEGQPFSWGLKLDSGECIFKFEEEGSEGKRCISIETLNNESSGRWESEYFPVESGRDYLFSVKVKLKLPDETKQCYFHITSKENIFITHFQPVLITDTSWNVWRGKVIMIPEGVSAIQCRFSLLENMEGQKVWIDEVKLTPLPRLNIEEESQVFSDSFNDITRWQVLSGQREYYNIVEDNMNKVLEYNDSTLGIIKAEWMEEKSTDVLIKLRVKVLEQVLLETKDPSSFGVYMIIDEYSSRVVDAYFFIFHYFHNIGSIELYYEGKNDSGRYFTYEYIDKVIGRDFELNQWHDIVFQKTGRLIKIFVDKVQIVAWYDFAAVDKPVSEMWLRFWKAQGIYQIDNIVVVPLKTTQ